MTMTDRERRVVAARHRERDWDAEVAALWNTDALFYEIALAREGVGTSEDAHEAFEIAQRERLAILCEARPDAGRALCASWLAWWSDFRSHRPPPGACDGSETSRSDPWCTVSRPPPARADDGEVTMSDKRDFNREYYEGHRAEILDKKRQRYATDEAFRERAKELARARRAQQKAELPVIHVVGADGRRVPHFGATDFADRIGKSLSTLNYWQGNGTLPPTPLRVGSQRLYTDAMVSAVQEVLAEIPKPEKGSSVFHDAVQALWSRLGEHVEEGDPSEEVGSEGRAAGAETADPPDLAGARGSTETRSTRVPSWVKAHPGLGVFTRNHAIYLDQVVALHAASPQRPVAFRSVKRWVSAKQAVEHHGSARLFVAAVGASRVTHVGTLSHVHLDPDPHDAETRALLALSAEGTEAEGLWDGTVQTLYLVTHLRPVPEPFTIDELIKLSDGERLSEDYQYGYALVREHRPPPATPPPGDVKYGFCQYSGRWVPRDDMVAVNVKAWDDQDRERKVRIRVARDSFDDLWRFMTSLRWRNELRTWEDLPK